MDYRLSAATRHVLLGIATIGAATSAYAQTPRAPAVPAVHTLAEAVPDAQGVRRMAILRGLDKITGRAIDLSAPLGVPVAFGTLTITVRFCHTVPPEEPPETTAFVQIDEMQPKATAATRIYSGWMFASTPALNGLEHPTYDVWPITCKTDQPAPAAAAPAPVASPGPANR
jgi:hypothetical protein